MDAEFPGGQHGAGDRLDGVVAALGRGAGVAVDGLRVGVAVEDRGLVVGVAFARGGPGAEDGVEFGAQRRGGPQGGFAHPVDIGRAPGEAAAAGPVGVAELVFVAHDGQQGAGQVA